MSPVDEVVELVLARPPTLGQGRLVSIDGPAGSGKSTLARMVASAVDKLDHRVVQMDDLVEGWRGLSGVTAQLEGILRPLADGRPGSYRRYDWLDGAFAETVTVEPVPLLVVEGVGSGAADIDDLRTLLVWVEAPYDERLRRGLERDGDVFAPHWQQWAADETELFTRERTRERADVRVDGTLPF